MPPPTGRPDGRSAGRAARAGRAGVGSDVAFRMVDFVAAQRAARRRGRCRVVRAAMRCSACRPPTRPAPAAQPPLCERIEARACGPGRAPRATQWSRRATSSPTRFALERHYAAGRPGCCRPTRSCRGHAPEGTAASRCGNGPIRSRLIRIDMVPLGAPGAGAEPMRLVLDHQSSDLLVLPTPLASRCGRPARRELRWIATAAIARELRGLAYPKLAARVDCSAAEPGWCRRLRPTRPRAGRSARAAVTCADPDDQKFIDLAVAHPLHPAEQGPRVLRCASTCAAGRAGAARL